MENQEISYAVNAFVDSRIEYLAGWLRDKIPPEVFPLTCGLDLFAVGLSMALHNPEWARKVIEAMERASVHNDVNGPDTTIEHFEIMRMEICSLLEKNIKV